MFETEIFAKGETLGGGAEISAHMQQFTNGLTKKLIIS